jgi:hypothetical protein
MNKNEKPINVICVKLKSIYKLHSLARIIPMIKKSNGFKNVEVM